MRLSETEIFHAAAALFEAERGRTQIGLVSLQYPHMDMDDAYAIQMASAELSIQAGRKIIGWKIGLTSRAMQEALGIDTPDSGVIFDDMAFENGAAVPKDRFIQPRAEAEIAFVMKAPLAGQVTRQEVLAATEHVAPSLELLDTRILRRDPASATPRNIFDTISDNAANAGLVLGAQRHAPDMFDLRWVGAVVRRNGVVEETGLGAGVLNDPVAAIIWLAARMEHYGQRIEAGNVVLSGSFIRPLECPPGSLIEAEFGDFGQASISFE